MKRVALALLVVAACSKKREVPIMQGEWKPMVDAVSSEKIDDRIVAVAFDADGVWRCSFAECTHFDANGKAGSRVTLPCRVTDPAFSPSRTRLAVACYGEDRAYYIVLVDLKPGTLERFSIHVTDAFLLAVDDRGIVTGIQPEESLTNVSRSSSSSSNTLSLPAPPPERETRPGEIGHLGNGHLPATGPWLAYTIGRRDGDYAWRDDGSQTLVPLDGELLFYDREQFLVRAKDDKLVEVSAMGRRVLGNAPPKTWKDPLDMIFNVDRWGADGVYATYNGRMQLRDREGHVRFVLPLFDSEAIPGFDPSGTHAYLWYSDGRVLVWDHPLE